MWEGSLSFVSSLFTSLQPEGIASFKEHTYLTWTSCRERPAPNRRHTSHVSVAPARCLSSEPSKGTLMTPRHPQDLCRLLTLNRTVTCAGAVCERGKFSSLQRTQSLPGVCVSVCGHFLCCSNNSPKPQFSSR